jgi:Glycosyl hydrolases family 35
MSTGPRCCSETTPLLGTSGRADETGPLPTPTMESAAEASEVAEDEEDDEDEDEDDDDDDEEGDYVAPQGTRIHSGHPRQQSRRGGSKRAMATPTRTTTMLTLPRNRREALALTFAGGCACAAALLVVLGVVSATMRRSQRSGVGDRFNQLASMAKELIVLKIDPTKTDVLAEHNHRGGNDNSDTTTSCSSTNHDHPTVTSRPGFPSYLDYACAASTPLNVTYDSRSFLINGDRAMFLSGSMHPVRATQATWTQSVNEAVWHNLNMVTLYVMWSAHQPFQSSLLNFDYMPTRPPVRSSEWSLAEAIRIAASRGLFVHVRVGPYVCAEYSYGGIPEWLPLLYPQMDMRRPHPQWYLAMERYVTTLVQYLSHHKLWAHQGGPIVLGQIENELQGDSEESSAALQGYADWCGAMAQRVAPHVVWTMCNGLVAPNTIETFNGDWAAAQWLARNGFSQRIQVDQPAMWTEAEGAND